MRRAGDEACSVEFRLRRDTPRGRERGPNGQVDFIWVEMRCRPLEQARGTLVAAEAEVVAVMRDVTDRKNQEAALDQARTAGRTGRRRQDPLSGYHEPRTSHAA